MTYELLHNHAPDETSVQRGVLLKKMKSKVRRNPSMPVRRVYDKCANDMDNDDYTPGFSNVRTRIKRIRSTFIPPIPRTVDDVSFNGTWAETWKGAKFLRHVDNDWGIAVFATKTMLEALAGVETMYIDGTFRTAPKPYSQFITVHGLVNGFVIPLAFCLATGKTIGQYRQLLQCLKRAVMRFCPGRNLAPGKTVIDFENSLMIAVETEFPMTRICCCYFHFNQSLWRHVQQLGLSGEYRRSWASFLCSWSSRTFSCFPAAEQCIARQGEFRSWKSGCSMLNAPTSIPTVHFPLRYGTFTTETSTPGRTTMQKVG